MKFNEKNLWEVNKAREKLNDFIDYIQISLPADVVRSERKTIADDDSDIVIKTESFPSRYSDVVDRPTLIVWIFDSKSSKRVVRNITTHVTTEGAQIEIEDGPGEAEKKLLVYYEVISRQEKREIFDSLEF